MSTVENVNQSVPLWWILVFAAVTLGVAALAVLAVGGYLVAPAV
ncbi:MAG: hypothetical protein ABEJ42_07350 [Halobacteriaceae archaeon]